MHLTMVLVLLVTEISSSRKDKYGLNNNHGLASVHDAIHGNTWITVLPQLCHHSSCNAYELRFVSLASTLTHIERRCIALESSPPPPLLLLPLPALLISPQFPHVLSAGASNPFTSFGASPGGAFAQQPSSPGAPFGQSSGVGATSSLQLKCNSYISCVTVLYFHQLACICGPLLCL